MIMVVFTVIPIWYELLEITIEINILIAEVSEKPKKKKFARTEST